MSDYLSLLPGATGPLAGDSQRFRVGSFELWVEVGESRDRYRAISCNVVYADGGLPRASVNLALGEPVGFNSSFEQLKIDDISQSIRRYSKIRVRMQVREINTSDQDEILPTVSPGTYTLLDGVISNSSVRRTGSSISLSISVQHRGIYLAAPNNIVSPFMNHGLTDAQVRTRGSHVYSSVMDSVLQYAQSKEVWSDQIVRSVKAIFDSTSSSLWSRRSRIQSVEAFSDLFEVNRQAVEMLENDEEFRNFLSFRTDITNNRLMTFIAFSLLRGLRNPSLLASLMSLGSALYYRITGLAYKMHVAPFYPFWPRSKMTTLQSGSYFLLDTNFTGLEAGLPIRGTLVKSNVDKGAHIHDAQATFTGAYQIPSDVDPLLSYVDVAVVPGWADFGGQRVSSGTVDQSDSPPRLVSVSSPENGVNEDNVGVSEQALSEPEVTDIASRFAAFNTFQKLLQGNSVSVMTGVRDDIVPGMNLRLDTILPGEEMSSEDMALYGYVDKVVLSVDSTSKTARMTTDLSFARQSSDQDVLDQAYESGAGVHFAWEDADQDIKSLRLWDKDDG